MNLQESLRVLNSGRVRKGEPVESACRSDRMNAIMDAVQALARGENVVAGINLRKRVSEGSFILSGMSGGSGRGGGSDLPFQLTLVTREDDPTLYSVQIADGKVNNEWPDVGTTTMGALDGPGYGTLDINDVSDSNVFIRVMFNSQTLAIARTDIYERSNETYPTNKITYLASGDPEPGACDSVDNPNTDPPPGYGSIYILLGFTYAIPGTPPAPAAPAIFQLEIGNVNFEFVAGGLNGAPAVLPVKTYSDWTAYPLPPP